MNELQKLEVLHRLEVLRKRFPELYWEPCGQTFDALAELAQVLIDYIESQE